MTIGPAPMCISCEHYDKVKGLRACSVFEIIPEVIWDGEHDHRYSHPKDNGVLFEQAMDVPPPFLKGPDAYA